MNKNLTSKDLCLYRGIPGIVILAISLLVAVRIGCDFGRDGFIQTVVFLGCNLTLWTLYVLLFQELPCDVLQLLTEKRRNAVEAMPCEKPCEVPLLLPCFNEPQEDFSAEETEEVTDEQHEQEDTPAVTLETVSVSPAPSYAFSSEKFCALNRQHMQRLEAERQHQHAIILEYAGSTMSPFLSEQSLSILLDEIQMWMNDCTHVPQPISLRVRLSTLDLQHFIWNIGKRLGARNGYDGTCMANFVKAMFPDIFKDKERVSIKNFTFNPNKGSIRIDRPSEEYGDMAFHYQQQETTEKSA